MTRKDYILLATALRDAHEAIIAKEPADSVRTLRDGADYAADYIADALAHDNPRFDRARFVAACRVRA